MAQSRVRAASRSFNLPNGDDGEADKAAITERTTTDIAKGGARPCYQTGTKHQVMDGRHDTTAAPQIQLFASKIGGTTQPRRSTSVPFRYVPKARVRCYQSVTTSYRHLAALRFLRLAVPRIHSLGSLLDGRVHRQGLELVTRYLQPGFAEERTGFSQVPGEPPLSVCHVPIRLRQDCLRQTIATQQRGPWYAKSRGSHERSFGAQ